MMDAFATFHIVYLSALHYETPRTKALGSVGSRPASINPPSHPVWLKFASTPTTRASPTPSNLFPEIIGLTIQILFIAGEDHCLIKLKLRLVFSKSGSTR